MLQTAGKRCHISGAEHDTGRKKDLAASCPGAQLLDGVVLTLVLLVVQHIAGDRYTTCPVQPAPGGVLCL